MRASVCLSVRVYVCFFVLILLKEGGEGGGGRGEEGIGPCPFQLGYLLSFFASCFLLLGWLLLFPVSVIHQIQRPKSCTDIDIVSSVCGTPV